MITTTLYRSYRSLFIVIFLALAACSTAPVDTSKQPDTAAKSAEELLKQAQRAEPAQRASYQLKAAQLYLQQGQDERAGRVLQAIAPQHLNAQGTALYLQLNAQLIALEHGCAGALTWLASDQQVNLLQQGGGQLGGLYQQRAQLQETCGDYLGAANTRIALSRQLDNEEALARNQDALWHALIQSPSRELERALGARPSDLQRGWYELTLLNRHVEGDIEAQLSQLGSWQQRWATHPAALQVPSDIELLRQLAESRPRQIAVLLPLQGPLQKAGNAIRDGILNAYFNASTAAEQRPQLRFYDTVAQPDMAQLYLEVVEDGAELIIGPLTKNRVDALLRYADDRVPVLALNYASDSVDAGDSGYQFGLSSDDDARAAAKRGAGLDYQRAMIIHGTDSQSVRGAAAFRKHWQQLGGDTVAEVEFDSERSTSDRIKAGLHVDLSQQRGRRMENITGTSLQYNPRRRQDIDFVYLPVGSQQARSIKPLLAFHFAQDIPVFATPRVYRGKPDPRRDADLNGVYFTDTPWALGEVPRQHDAIAAYIKRGGAPSKNLYALGIDAYHLAPRIPQLLFTPGLAFNGLTGSISLGHRGQFIRHPSWAVFRGGLATAIEEQDDEGKEAIHPQKAQKAHQPSGPTL